MIFVIALSGATLVSGQNPVANFTSDVTTGCAPLLVRFTDASTGNPTTWNWEFSNGTLSSVQNPAVTFNDPGTYSVKLVVQNANGIAQVERINYITVLPSPTAAFTADLNLACLPATINFTDQSTPGAGSITSWNWEFGDGGTSTAQNPSHTYNNVGFYTVTLTVISSSGCMTTTTRSSYIRIVAGVETDFTFDLPTTCQAPFIVPFQNQSIGPGNIAYSWDFGNSQTSTDVNPTAIYNAEGTYNVTLNTMSDLGCGGSIQKTITISGVGTDFTAPTSACLGQPVNFQNNSSSPPVSSFWDFGDGTFSGQINPIKTFLTPGTYDVTVVNQYEGCRDSITKQITITGKPVVDFTVVDSISCSAPFTVQFTDVTPGATSWLWDFGDGNTSTLQNPSHTYQDFGEYSVSLTVSTGPGCSNSIVKPAIIKIRPITMSINAPAGGCVPFTYTPQATVSSIDNIVSYQWDLGEPGAVFTGENPPPYTYNNPGTYAVTLTVTTEQGCVQTLTVPNAVQTGTPPIADFSFSPNNVCASEMILFQNQSTVSPGADVSFLWNFGDGESSSLQNPQHIYTDTGLLTITLIVFNNRCPDTAEQQITVLPPVALFNYTVNCATNQVTFRDSSLVDPGLTPLTYSWQMGDPANTTFNVKDPPPFTYPGPGTYNVTLTVTNGSCSYTTTEPVTIADEPADFTIDHNPVCRNGQFTLSAINSNASNIQNYEWEVDGVTVGSGRSITHRIADNGVYDVTLIITDINGCITSKTMPDYITVGGPVANFEPANPGACLSRTTTFTDLSTPAGSIVNWHFAFGDGHEQDFTSGPFTHVYDGLGTYSVSLTITDAQGCTDTYTLPADLIVSDPIAGFRADTFYCPGAPLSFIDTSSGAGLSYQWYFGDGNTSTIQNPTNVYPTGDADYTVKLVITDISGCTDSLTKDNYIKIRSPKAAFSLTDTTTICPPLRTSFLFEGSDYESFYWDFGDGGISTIPNPSYFYGNYGNFTPTLVLTGPGGCVDSVSSLVTVHNPNNFQINYGPPTTACNSLNVDFSLVVPAGFKFHFFFGDGSVDSSGATTLSHFYSRPSKSHPRLLVFDTLSGCQAGLTASPRIDVLGAIPLFDKDISKFCDNGTVVFSDFTTKNEPIISTVWDFDDGNTSSEVEPTHFFAEPGTYLVTLNVTTQSNCSSSYTDTIFVYRTPEPVIGSRDTVCVGSTENFLGSTVIADTAIAWLWNSPVIEQNPNQNIAITFNNVGDYPVSLIARNLLGCSDTISKVIHVMPPPTATPVQNPVTINVGGGTDLLMDYTGDITSYTWTPASGLNCTTCPVPFASPSSNTTYTVEIQNVHGCMSSSEITVNVVCNGLNYFMPNTFSPNGDGQNDVFYPRGSGLFRIKSLLIFNRWGEVVFERKDFRPNEKSAGWDGTFKGQKASSDVYVYMLEILCDNNMVVPLKGNVTLLR